MRNLIFILLISIPILCSAKSRISIDAGVSSGIDDGTLASFQKALNVNGQQYYEDKGSTGSYTPPEYPSLSLIIGLDIWPDNLSGLFYSYNLNITATFWKYKSTGLFTTSQTSSEIDFFFNDLDAGYEFKLNNNLSISPLAGISYTLVNLNQSEAVKETILNKYTLSDQGIGKITDYWGLNAGLRFRFYFSSSIALTINLKAAYLYDFKYNNPWSIGNGGLVISYVI